MHDSRYMKVPHMHQASCIFHRATDPTHPLCRGVFVVDFYRSSCGRGELNPHGFCPLDPKSSASASSATSAKSGSNTLSHETYIKPLFVLSQSGLRGIRTPDPVIKSHLLYQTELAALLNNYNDLHGSIDCLVVHFYRFFYHTGLNPQVFLPHPSKNLPGEDISSW